MINFNKIVKLQKIKNDYIFTLYMYLINEAGLEPINVSYLSDLIYKFNKINPSMFKYDNRTHIMELLRNSKWLKVISGTLVGGQVQLLIDEKLLTTNLEYAVICSNEIF